MNFCTNSPKRGWIAADEEQRVGVVTHETQYFDSTAGHYRTRYFGVLLIGGEWESRDPEFLFPNIHSAVFAFFTQAPSGAAGPDSVPPEF